MGSESVAKKIGKIHVYKSKEIGRGSDGVVVYEGSFEDIPVAVKRISQEFLCNEADLLRSNNSHENIVRYYVSEKDDDFMYIAMELCSGTLENLVNRTYQGPEVGSMREVLRQTSLGLQYLHEKKIVHRDLKPQNILISIPDGTVPPRIKLSDFGISKRQTSDRYFTKTGTAGTVGWGAPEFYDDTTHRYDYSVDIFSLGCVFGYALSGGHHPFGKTDFRVGNIKQDKLDWVGEGSICDEEVKKLIKAMIDREPKTRPKVNDILRHPFLSHTRPTPTKIPREGDFISESAGVTVYKGTVNGCPRAIKRIKINQYPTNYKKELEILSKLANTDCLLRYFSHEEDMEFCFIEMELCIVSLDQIFQNCMSSIFGLEPLKSRDFMKQVIQGLFHLHETNVVHRDLKPPNVLVQNANGRLIPKIADYGISESVNDEATDDGLRRTTLCRGTDGWKAPKLKNKSTYSKAVDVFATGCLLFYIETQGSHPLSNDQLVLSHESNGTLQKNINKNRPNIEALKNIEPTLLDLICRALEPNVELRISSAKMLDHVAFKSSKEALECFREAVEQHFKDAKKFPGEDDRLREIIIFKDWRKKLEPVIIQEASRGMSGRKKQVTEDMGNSIYELLLLIRNKHSHFNELDQKVKDTLGDPPEKYFCYWHMKFPRLLIRTWNAINKINYTPELQLQIDSRADRASLEENSESFDAVQERLDNSSGIDPAGLSLSFNTGTNSQVHMTSGNSRELSALEEKLPKLVIDEQEKPSPGNPLLACEVVKIEECNEAAAMTSPELISVDLNWDKRTGAKFIDGLWLDTSIETMFPFTFMGFVFGSAMNFIRFADSSTWFTQKELAFRHNITCILLLKDHVKYPCAMLVLGDHIGWVHLYCTRTKQIVATDKPIDDHKEGVKRLELSPERSTTEIIVQYSKTVCLMMLDRTQRTDFVSSGSCSCKDYTFKSLGKHEFGTERIPYQEDSIVQAATWFGGKVAAVALRNQIDFLNGPEKIQPLELKSSHIPENVDEKLTFSRHTQKVTALIWLPNKTAGLLRDADTPLIASGCAGGLVFIWNATSGDIIHEIAKENVNPIVSMSFSPMGKMFVTASSDKSVELWKYEEDGQSGEKARQPTKIHSFIAEEKVTKISWHPGGKTFAAGFINGQIKFWIGAQ